MGLKEPCSSTKGSEYPRFINKEGSTIWVKARPIGSKWTNWSAALRCARTYQISFSNHTQYEKCQYLTPEGRFFWVAETRKMLGLNGGSYASEENSLDKVDIWRRWKEQLELWFEKVGTWLATRPLTSKVESTGEMPSFWGLLEQPAQVPTLDTQVPIHGAPFVRPCCIRRKTLNIFFYPCL